MLLAALVPVEVFAADTENFYFEDFSSDYYLSRDAEGISHLKVVENFTAIFPDYNQNKGICRMIPFTNQDNKNVTLPDLTTANIKVTRNGLVEPIYSIEKQKNYFEVCTGDENYVLGKQVYTFEYDFEKVVTDFAEYQELYWDTNGNGWWQKFEKVTARVHFVGDVKEDYAGKSWCYVGKYGDNGSERCVISEISDGVQFSAKDLTHYENLTFDVELKPGSFTVPEVMKNYKLVFVMVGFSILCMFILSFPCKKFLKTREKAKYYKSLFVKPEFTPEKEYNVAEMAEVYIGKKHDAKVAVLLEMIVNHKITLIEKESKGLKKKWAVKVLSINGISEEGMCLLKILAGGAQVDKNDEIEIKTRTATSALVSLKKSYERAILTKLKRHKLVEEDYKISVPTSVIGTIIVILCLVLPIGAAMAEFFEEDIDWFDMVGAIVGQDVFMPVMIGLSALTTVAYVILSSNYNKYISRTKKGLLVSRYMDGLKLYIKMAEKDRLELLQSTKGVQVSPDGIVKLYEKLLPYAAVLGLEKSWMKELEKYYKLENVETPDWYINNLAAYSILNAVNTAANTVSSSTTYASSGGSSSSGFSGGGGGGFSGGGGGGGGGCGR